MKIPTWLADIANPVRRKVRRMTGQQMVMWLDVAGSEMSKALHEHVRTGKEEPLREAERGLATLIAMVEELRERLD